MRLARFVLVHGTHPLPRTIPPMPRSRLAPIAALALLAPALVPGAARAQAGYADLASIDRDLAAFTGAAPGLPGGAAQPVDRRLRLAACGAPIAYGWRSPRHDAVLVQCPDAGSWHIYVAVRQAAGDAAGPIAVERNESVTIAVTGDGFAVSQPGEALDPGAVGDWIRVRAVKDGSPRSDPVRARIVQPGLVEVPLP